MLLDLVWHKCGRRRRRTQTHTHTGSSRTHNEAGEKDAMHEGLVCVVAKCGKIFQNSKKD